MEETVGKSYKKTKKREEIEGKNTEKTKKQEKQVKEE